MELKTSTFVEKEAVEEYYEKNHWKITFKRMLKDWRLYVMVLPLVFIFICWRYAPMYGLVISFKSYDGTKSILEADFVGLEAFSRLLKDSLFWRAFRNTFMLSFYGLCFGFPMPIILALLFSEVQNKVYRNILQILSYLPKFVSVVVMTTLVNLLCTSSTGNMPGGLLTQLCKALHLIRPNENGMYVLIKDPNCFRAVYQVSGIWEAAGYGSIVYFAAILGISPTSYEAARMDGANKWSQIRFVTFPGIASTLTIMLILEVGKLFTVGYEKVLLLQDTKTYETSDIIATFVMRNSGMASAGNAESLDVLSQAIAASADLFNAVIAMLLVIGANMISRRVSDTSLY